MSTDREQAEALLLGACILVAYHANRSSDALSPYDTMIHRVMYEGRALADDLKTALAAVLPK